MLHLSAVHNDPSMPPTDAALADHDPPAWQIAEEIHERRRVEDYQVGTLADCDVTGAAAEDLRRIGVHHVERGSELPRRS